MYVCYIRIHLTICLLCIDMCIVHNMHLLVCVSTIHILCNMLMYVCNIYIFTTIHVCIRISIYLPKTKKFGCVGRGDLTSLFFSKVVKY